MRSCKKHDTAEGKSDLILPSAVEQPLKIPFVAAIVLLANAQKPELTADVLAKVKAALQQRLEIGAWREVKLYLRLLGCLQAMFEGDGVFTILEELFSRAADLQMKSSEDVCHSSSDGRIPVNTPQRPWALSS